MDGLCFPIDFTDDFPRGCAKWTGIGTSLISGLPVVATLRCCLSGCMGSDWQWDPPGKLILYGGPVDDNWTCDPAVLLTWTGVMPWDGTAPCVGVPFTVVVSEVPC